MFIIRQDESNSRTSDQKGVPRGIWDLHEAVPRDETHRLPHPAQKGGHRRASQQSLISIISRLDNGHSPAEPDVPHNRHFLSGRCVGRACMGVPVFLYESPEGLRLHLEATHPPNTPRVDEVREEGEDHSHRQQRLPHRGRERRRTRD